jgi:hypothetical protein
MNNGNWVFITPIYNLELSKEINGEISIGRVLFVNRKKIPNIRKRLGFPCVFSKLNEENKRFFETAETFAFLPFSGSRHHNNEEYEKIVEDSVNILAFSQLGYYSRKRIRQLGLSKGNILMNNLILKKNTFESIGESRIKNNVRFLNLGTSWKNFHKEFFFFDLISILYSRQEKMQKSWKETIERAVIMSGKSLRSLDLEYSFLWNMIIIEMLLTEQGDKYSERLPERIEAFLGWIDCWQKDGFQERIKELYAKRCKFVHDGNSKSISKEDLQFTDDIVFNVLWNIIKHISIFPSKKSIIEFSDKIKAEKILNVKSRVLPKTVMFLNREYLE